MADYGAASVGIDVAKLRNAIAIAEAGREGEVRFSSLRRQACCELLSEWPAGLIGRISDTRLVRRAMVFSDLIRSLGRECNVVAPSLVPRKLRDRAENEPLLSLGCCAPPVS